MKRKIIITVVLYLFAGLTVLNVGLTHRPDKTDSTLDLISVMAKALEEGEGEGRPKTFTREWRGPYTCNDRPEVMVYCKECLSGGTQRCTQTCPPC
jgi:hypothetical protein